CRSLRPAPPKRRFAAATSAATTRGSPRRATSSCIPPTARATRPCSPRRPTPGSPTPALGAPLRSRPLLSLPGAARKRGLPTPSAGSREDGERRFDGMWEAGGGQPLGVSFCAEGRGVTDGGGRRDDVSPLFLDHHLQPAVRGQARA